MALYLSPPMTTNIIETGDLLFIHPQPNVSSPLSMAVMDTGNATIEWLRDHGNQPDCTDETADHVAMAWRNVGNELFFIQAYPPQVTMTSAEDFITSIPLDTTIYHAKIVNPVYRNAADLAAKIAKSLVGMPYAETFEMPPDYFYCSSLIEFAFQQAVGMQIPIFCPVDFIMLFEPPQFWIDYYSLLNRPVPRNVVGTNPTLMLHSSNLEFSVLDGRDAFE